MRPTLAAGLQRGACHRACRRVATPAAVRQAASTAAAAALPAQPDVAQLLDLGAPAFVTDILLGPIPAKLFTVVVLHDTQGRRVLLGEKKRGIGAGYFVGFGGKVEPGESVCNAAQRELHEEACIEAEDLQQVGMLTIVFEDKPVPWEVHVFSASRYRGEPAETDEMRPQWFAADALPFDQMWADCVHWYPALLAGHRFAGVVGFTGETTLLWHHLSVTQAVGARAQR